MEKIEWIDLLDLEYFAYCLENYGGFLYKNELYANAKYTYVERIGEEWLYVCDGIRREGKQTAFHFGLKDKNKNKFDRANLNEDDFNLKQPVLIEQI